jgi:hypothetical protein
MGSPAANHAEHTFLPEAARATGMWHYGAILVGKSPIRLEMAGTPARQGGRRPARSRLRSYGIACDGSWAGVLAGRELRGRKGCSLAATDGWRESDQ